jgi:hypothetical protein
MQIITGKMLDTIALELRKREPKGPKITPIELEVSLLV